MQELILDLTVKVDTCSKKWSCVENRIMFKFQILQLDTLYKAMATMRGIEAGSSHEIFTDLLTRPEKISHTKRKPYYSPSKAPGVFVVAY